VKERENSLRTAENAADKCASDIERKEDEITDMDGMIAAHQKSAKEGKGDLLKLERKLADLKAKANSEPIVVDTVGFNERVVGFPINQLRRDI